MAFTKVTESDREGKGVLGLPDTPALSTRDIQARFDSLGNLALDSLNKLIDELSSNTALQSIPGPIAGRGDTLLLNLLSISNDLNEYHAYIKEIDDSLGKTSLAVDHHEERIKNMETSIGNITGDPLEPIKIESMALDGDLHALLGVEGE